MFETDYAGDGISALQLACSNRYDAIILDVMLPGKSGYEILADLRADAELADMPVLVLSARGQEAERGRAIAAGASRFMPKPFANDEILAALREMAEQ